MSQEIAPVLGQPLPYPWWLWRSPRQVRGRELRYLLTSFLMASPGPMTVPELVEACAEAGVEFAGRPSKIVSDSLRWEIRWGRVVRLRRGVYAFHRIPRSTKRWIQVRAAHLLSVLAKLGERSAWEEHDHQARLNLPAPPAAYLGQTGPQRPPLAPDRQRSARTIAKLKQICSR